MLKNILDLEGTQEITASEQKKIIGINVMETVLKCDSSSYMASLVNEDCADYYSEMN
ncbi:hypothetical protein [Flavobacterium gelatinilyticum]|uniref:hypothetical protein n=1 Tax=Flavobacterium gelatinilyticum TaxID=3003260 RepID=UPI0024810C21|nr:hypothetical protein [Flavobacterium gelatinilyticum]